MKKEMLINVAQSEECRIAIVEDGILEELYVERSNQESYVGNIYKGKIVNIEPSIQAAFVDFGIGRNGFLHVSDVDPAYYKHLLPKHILEEIEAEEEARFGVGPRQSETESRSDERRGRMSTRAVIEAPADSSEPHERPLPRSESPPIQAASEPEEEVFGAGVIEESFGFMVEEPPGEAPRTSSPLEPPGRAEPLSSVESQRPAEPSRSVESPRRAERPHLPERPPQTRVHRGQKVTEAPATEAPAVGTSALEASAVGASALGASAAKGIDAEEDFGDFGAGLDLPSDHPVANARSQAAEQSSVTPETSTTSATRAGEPLEANTSDEAADQQAAVQPEMETTAGSDGPRKRGGGRKSRSRMKLSETAEAPPPYMDTAEHHTSSDEPEEMIQPLFRPEEVEDFDANAPNDRFAPPPASEGLVHDDAFSFDDESVPGYSADQSAGESAGQTVRESAGQAVGESASESRPVASAATGAEADEFAPPWSGEEHSDVRPSRRGERGARRRDVRRGSRREQSGPAPGRPPRDKGYPRLPIEQIFKRGQEVIVQVIKEGIGTKGPTLSTYLSIAGRYLVLMPSLQRVGVSRKIEDIHARRRLREIMRELNPPPGVGFIVRTAAIDRNPEELQSDLAYLLRLWQVIVHRLRKVSAPVEIYRESDMITRTIRDNFTSDITSIVVDDPVAYQHAAEFMQVVMPRYADRIRLHQDPEPLFSKYRLDEEIAKLNQKRIELPKGGSIIIEQTEALVAIDVNSGTYRSEKDAEETAYQVNLMAAKEIARQLRLRDLGGVIVNDFIDMRDERHRRHVEKTLHEALERDKARTRILRISAFGIIEMTRQRMQQSLKKRIYVDCPHCHGTGHVKTSETLGIEAMRLLHLAASKAIARSASISLVQLNVCPEAAHYLLNKKRREIAALEDQAQLTITIAGVPGASPDLLEVKCQDANGNEVRLLNSGPPPKLGRGRRSANGER